ncbi:hypothetical protein JAAARDRAFT_654248 [Jaapia argillacea MUCL 33604]|uniref:Uncharacterized protein n=1 Tax=Jaapia argillacea MUCL 33604 TaxID=933084 RepID=A0A067Q6M9_9AGAM|nr:hypothetical protein JAAARDRAFT_654248 [Jaapia argillacea MUCL 33604]
MATIWARRLPGNLRMSSVVLSVLLSSSTTTVLDRVVDALGGDVHSAANASVSVLRSAARNPVADGRLYRYLFRIIGAMTFGDHPISAAFLTSDAHTAMTEAFLLLTKQMDTSEFSDNSGVGEAVTTYFRYLSDFHPLYTGH